MIEQNYFEQFVGDVRERSIVVTMPEVHVPKGSEPVYQHDRLVGYISTLSFDPAIFEEYRKRNK